MCTELKPLIENEILQILQQSPVPEDYRHALNVREWVKRLKPDACLALQIAALGHDIERAMPDRKVRRADFASYDDFKQAHAKNSARILRELLARFSLQKQIIDKVSYWVANHEFGVKGNRKLAILKDADSLSFFEINLPFYFEREGGEETFRRMQWGYRRLSRNARRYLQRFHFREVYISDGHDLYRDDLLSEFACYLTTINADPALPAVAKAQIFFLRV